MLDRKEFSSDDVHWELTPTLFDRISKFKPLFFMVTFMGIGGCIGYYINLFHY